MEYTLKSLADQTYKNFVVHLIDHGSCPAVDPEKLPKDLDIRFDRYRTNYIEQHGNDIAEKILSQLEGDYFINFADDDILLPNALEIVAAHLQANPRIEIIGGGFLSYDHDRNSSLCSMGFLDRFDGTLTPFNGYKAALRLCSGWGIGPVVNYPIPPQSHASTGFYSVKLMHETKKKQGTIYVRSCGDVGFLGLTLNTDYTYYLNSPLAIIGCSANQIMNHYTPNNRFKWKDELQYLEYTPVRGCSFQNIGTDSHLKVLHAHGINKIWDCSLRPHFFINHIMHILTDDPWTQQAYQDIDEAMPFLEESIVKYHNCSRLEAKPVANTLINNYMEKLMKERKEHNKLEQSGQFKLYDIYKNILDHSDSVMKYMRSKPMDSKKTSSDSIENESQLGIIGVWGFYEEAFKNNGIFLNPNAGIGDNLSKPMNDFYRVALQNSIEVKSLDMIHNFAEVDAFLFWDFPKVDNPLVNRAITSGKPCYLVVAESPLIRPDNWLKQNQNQFTKIFTYCDDIIDNKRYFKLNYASNIPSTIDKDLKMKKKLCTVIAGNKQVNHELSLYPHRKEAIKWFENHHPNEFDLYGIGWDPKEYPSYRGRIDSKLKVLKGYRFSICYENIRDINGYITEKIIDCLKAGCVPVYWGAKNISDHIPKGCFIDKRDFADYESLYTYLKEMTDEKYQEYLKSIEEFFNSEKVYPFTTESFIKTVLEQISNRSIHVIDLQNGALSTKDNGTEDKLNNGQKNETIERGLFNTLSKKEPLVSISMTHYNRLDCLKKCVASIRRHTSGRYELIIIDNGSTDGVSLEYLRSLSDIILVEIQSNIRPDSASLKGLAMANGDFITTISDDIIVTPGWLDMFLEHMKENPKVGLIGPRSNQVTGPQFVSDVPYRDIRELTEFAIKWSEKFRGRVSNVGRLVGFCIFFRREVLEKIGGTDPGFSFGFNDDDFTLRTIIAGYDAIIAHDIFIHHIGGPQSQGDSEYMRKAMLSWEYFKRKWGLPPDLKYGPFDIRPLLAQKFDPKRHFVPLPDRSEVKRLIYKPQDYDGQLEETELQEKAGAAPDENAYQIVQRFIKDGREKEAIGALKCFLASYPEYAFAYNDLGCLYRNNGNKEKALEHYKQAVNLEPENETFQRNLADSYYVDAGNIEEALRIYLGLLEKNPVDIETFLTLGQICISLEKVDDAAVFYNKVIELEPLNEHARGKLDSILNNNSHRI